MDLRRIVSSDERMETCRELTELLTRELPSSEGTIKMSMNVLQDKSIYGPEFSEWKKDGTNPDETPTIKCVGEIELVDRHGKKEVGYIFAMAVVGDRFLVAVDLYKRPCLRCFDVDIGKQVGHCAFDTGARPTGLTTIPGNRVAVTLPYSVWFLRVTENGDLSSENQMKVNKIYQGIASCGDNLIVSYKHPDPGVRILDMKGNVLKEFEKDYDDENLFEWPNCMAVGPDHSTIYITEKGNKSVTALTMEGHVGGVVVVKELEPFPTYITVDSGGRVYVCGFDTVFLVSFESGTVIPLLDKRNGITNSRCMSVHDQTRHLYVGSWYSNVIMVFEMPKLATA
ncbi:uncharacterized protein LOC128239986 [Mya arenaria]|uniref:uncharacterized protein LOC128239986 n=1 Tax=Mya arenaria TaxID=6604 RepID=UPI0022E19721|nr:uncharacterized protein LOC128239986 [Mya arenaria]